MVANASGYGAFRAAKKAGRGEIHSVAYWVCFPLVVLFRVFFFTCKFALLAMVWPVSAPILLARKKRVKNLSNK